jgi:hypothetical protein
MKKNRQAQKSKMIASREVETHEGPGVIVGQQMRSNTNGGPGCSEYRVQLADGRVRAYKPSELQLPPGNGWVLCSPEETGTHRQTFGFWSKAIVHTKKFGPWLLVASFDSPRKVHESGWVSYGASSGLRPSYGKVGVVLPSGEIKVCRMEPTTANLESWLQQLLIEP